MQLEGKVALVTGAGAGIGQATARMLANRGARVIAIDIEERGLEETKTGAPEDAVVSLVADATQATGAEAGVEAARARFGGLHILVNVVGGSRPGKTIVELDESEWDFWVRLNLTSVFLVSRAAIPLMAESGGGSIVHISSGAALTGMARNPAYVAAKGGVVALTKAMAIDHAPDRIRVNCVAPGPILTPLMKRNRSPEEIEFMSKMNLVGRLGRPEEIAATVAFLSSEDGAFINGEVISVAGGRAGPI